MVFKNVGGGTFDLATLEVKKNTGADYGTSGMSSIKANGFIVRKMSTAGAYLTDYHYITCISGSGAVPQKGWYEGGTNLVASPVLLNDGEGVIILTTKSDAAILMNGEVDLVCKNTVPNGWSFSGNSTPKEFKLTDISVIKNSGAEYSASGMGSIKANGFTIRKISSAGAYLDAYHYITCVSGSGAVAEKGWYKNGNVLVTSESEDNLTFAPGEGFIVLTTKSDAMLVLPSPISE